MTRDLVDDVSDHQKYRQIEYVQQKFSAICKHPESFFPSLAGDTSPNAAALKELLRWLLRRPATNSEAPPQDRDSQAGRLLNLCPTYADPLPNLSPSDVTAKAKPITAGYADPS